MRLIFLGTGSAFTVGCDNYHSNMILCTADGKSLLIDCGSDIRHSLYEQNFTYRDINDVYISHLHADHAGGLEWLGFSRKFESGYERPRLFINQEYAVKLWDNMLSGSMRSIEGEHATLETYFAVQAIDAAGQFTWGDRDFQMIATEHVMDGDKAVPSYGLCFQVGSKMIFITTDCVYCPSKLMPIYQTADLIFHDCETTARKSGVHAHYTELVQLPDTIRRKMWLYHYSEGQLPDATAAGFAGFVAKGQTFDLLNANTYELPTKYS